LITQKYLSWRDLLHIEKLPAASTNRNHSRRYLTSSKHAAPAPTTAKLIAIITTLQAQIVALQNTAPAAAAAPPAGAATMVFADTPQMLGANDLINFLTKRGLTIFEQGYKPLDDKALMDSFAMTPDQTVILLKRSTVVPPQWA
jgi:hypothetical protein